MQIGPGPSGITDLIEARPDKESRILHRRLGEHHANMTATLAGIKDLAEAGRSSPACGCPISCFPGGYAE